MYNQNIKVYLSIFSIYIPELKICGNYRENNKEFYKQWAQMYGDVILPSI